MVRKDYPKKHTQDNDDRYGEILQFFKSTDWQLAEEKFAYDYTTRHTLVKILCKNSKEDIAYSILVRANDFKPNQYRFQKNRQYVENDLYETDNFGPIGRLEPDAPLKEFQDMGDFDIMRKDTFVITGHDTKTFDYSLSILLKVNQLVGFDSEFQQEGKIREVLKLIQFSTKDQNFIFIIANQKKNAKFTKFLHEIFERVDITKITHSFQGDLTVINNFFGSKIKEKNCSSIIELTECVMREDNGQKMSLGIMCEALLGKKLCKYNQRSNWGMSPLRLSQIHYAAMDSLILIQLYHAIMNRKPMDPSKFLYYDEWWVLKPIQQLSRNSKTFERQEEKLIKSFQEFEQNVPFLTDFMLNKIDEQDLKSQNTLLCENLEEQTDKLVDWTKSRVKNFAKKIGDLRNEIKVSEVKMILWELIEKEIDSEMAKADLEVFGEKVSKDEKIIEKAQGDIVGFTKMETRIVKAKEIFGLKSLDKKKLE